MEESNFIDALSPSLQRHTDWWFSCSKKLLGILAIGFLLIESSALYRLYTAYIVYTVAAHHSSSFKRELERYNALQQEYDRLIRAAGTTQKQEHEQLIIRFLELVRHYPALYLQQCHESADSFHCTLVATHYADAAHFMEHVRSYLPAKNISLVRLQKESNRIYLEYRSV